MFLRVRTRLLAAPDYLPRCPHWREPVPAGYTPLTGWGLRQDSPTSRRLPDILDGGVVEGLVGTATTHQARESQMELKNKQTYVQTIVEVKAREVRPEAEATLRT
jgi:hypothetical protein